MAVTKSQVLHGRVQNAITYIINPDKTEPEYIYCSSGAMPEVAGLLWEVSNANKGNNCNTRKNGVVGWHEVFSLPPGEGDIDTCYRLAKEWIEAQYGTEYDYVLAVHTNEPHLHAHIVLNPVSNITGKSLRFNKKEIEMKRDRMEALADELCRREGLSVIDNPERNNKRSYYHWKQLQNPKWLQLKDILDNAILEVSSYKDLRMYMEAMGFEFKDKTQIEEENKFVFRINEVLYYPGGVDDGDNPKTIPFFIPGTKRQVFAKFSPDEYEVLGDGNQIKVEMDLEKYSDGIPVYDVITHQEKIISKEDFIKYFDEKALSKNTLRIRLPGAKNAVTSRVLDSKSGTDSYSYDAIVKRIKENGRDKTDEKILQTIREYQRIKSEKLKSEKQRELFDQFVEEHNVKLAYDASPQSQMTRYEIWASVTVHKIMDMQESWISLEEWDDAVEKLDAIKEELEEMKMPYRELSLKELELEKAYSVIERQRQEGFLDMTDAEVNEWVGKYLKPVQEQRTAFKNRHAKLLAEVDRLEDMTLSKKDLEAKKIERAKKKASEKMKHDKIYNNKRRKDVR